MRRRVTARVTGAADAARTPRARRTVGLIVTVALAAGLPLAVTAAPASAHGATHSITPAAGAALATAPAQVEVVFAAQITSDSTVAVIDRTGTDWADGPPVVHGATLRHRVRAGMPDGGYEIRWHVTFTDGHPVTGTAEFRVGARAAAAPNPFQARVSHGGVVAFQFAAGTAVFALLLAVMTLSRGVYAASKHESPREGSTL